MKYLYFDFQVRVLKETTSQPGLQSVHLDRLSNAGASAWQAEPRCSLISYGIAEVSLRRQGLWKSPVMLLTAHKLLKYLISPLSFSPPFFFFPETELSVTAELVPTSSWNISSELDKGTQWGCTGEMEGGRRETPFLILAWPSLKSTAS